MSNLIPINLCEEAIKIKDEEIAKLKADLTNLKAEADRLKIQNERLIKAGDLLGEWVVDFLPDKKAWKAAKEGRDL